VVAKIKLDRISYSYGDHQVLSDVTLDVPERAITSFFGPAQSGKTTLLRLINRLNDHVEGTHMSGTILLGGEDIYAPNIHLPSLRRRVGMVFALPLPLPGTIRDNIVYGPRLAGIRDRETLDELVVQSLQAGQRTIRRPAATPLHSPQPGARAGGLAARRTHVRARPSVHVLGGAVTY